VISKRYYASRRTTSSNPTTTSPTPSSCSNPPNSSYPYSTHSSHPQTQLPTSSTRSNPILTLMKLRNTRYSRNTLPTQLSELLSIRSIHIYKSIHVSNDETLDVVGGLELPLCAKTGFCQLVSMQTWKEGKGKGKGRGKKNVHGYPTAGLIVMWYDSGRGHLFVGKFCARG
jgi:hypothetical protein